MTRRVRTRIAPSPTGFLHLGTARTALFSWAFARHHGGDFILRIEDTDVARSTQEAVDQIIAAMKWLALDYDEGPFYQMQRLDRYREVIGKMLADGTAYHCYCTPDELEAMREAQRARGEKPRYDGRWRPEPGKTLPPAPAGVPPVVRFRNPVDGDVTWNDMVKGPITISNRELDDLIICRPDGTPTYNFCVVVDDWDMQISHVIRGDDHVNNTPRQINILRALGAELPEYGHVPMILGPGRRQALQAPRCGQRDAVRGGRLPARRDGQLPRAAGLEPWRRRTVRPRAAGRVVRRAPPGAQSGAVGCGQAELGQRPRHQAHGGCRCWRDGGRALRWPRRRTRRRRSAAAHVRLVQGSLRDAGRTGGLARHVLRRRRPARGRRGAARHGSRASRRCSRCATAWPTSTGTRARSPRPSRRPWWRTG